MLAHLKKWQGEKSANKIHNKESLYIIRESYWSWMNYFRTGQFVVKCFAEYRHVKLEWVWQYSVKKSKYIKSKLVITPTTSLCYLGCMWMLPVHGAMELGSIRKSVNEDAGQRAPIIPPLQSLPDTPIRNHLPNLVINLEKGLNHN